MIRPTESQLLDTLQKPGNLGGLSLRPITLEEFRCEHMRNLTGVDPWVADHHLDAAKKDVKAIAHVLKASPARKANLPWSAPAKLFLLCLWPSCIPYRREAAHDQFKAGIDATAERYEAPLARRFLYDILVAVRRLQLLPLDATRSQGWIVNKGTTAEGTKAVRLLHGLCDFWKASRRACHNRKDTV